MKERSREITGLTFAVGAALAFSTLAISVVFAYRAGAQAAPLLAARFTIATVLLAVMQLARRKPILLGVRSTLRIAALGATGYALESGLFFAALDHAPASVVAIVFYSYPIWTSLIALTLRYEPLRWSLLAALGLATVGLLVIFTIPAGYLTGMLLAMGAAVAVAIYLVAAQRVTRGVDPGTSGLWTAAGAAVSTGLAASVTGQSITIDALPHAATLGAATAVAFMLLYAAVERIGSARTAVAATAEPVGTVLLAALLLDEPITARIMIGMVLVVAALPVLASSARRDEGGPAVGDTI